MKVGRVLVVVALLGVAPIAGAGHAASVGATPSTADTHRPVPDGDVIGWEDGYWHDETIEIDRGDGIDEAERDAIVARAMARVETVRQLEFEEPVPVEVVSREELRQRRLGQLNDSVSTADRLHQNVKFEAVFFLGEDEDAVTALESEYSGGAIAQYDLRTGEILLSSPDPDALEIDELTLAHELVHALQDQHNLTPDFASRQTEDGFNGLLGITEGDPQYVMHRYGQRCDRDWDCVDPTSDGGSGADRHIGIALLRLFPYSEGPVFVEHVHENAGWEAVNAVYDAPPVSSEQLIHPAKYPNETPANLTIEDRSDDRWRVLELNDSIDHATFGEAGLFMMMWYPSYTTRRDQVVPFDIFDRDEPAVYDYSHDYTNGWDGDRLLPYVTNSSAATNETGYVWKTSWDTWRDARQFHGAYEQLLVFHGAESHGPRTWVIEDGRFADAFHVSREGRAVTIVNAPTVDGLRGIRSDLIVRTPTPTDTPDRTDDGSRSTPPADGGRTPTTVADDQSTPPTATDIAPAPVDGPGQPGFGLLGAAGLLLALLWLGRRHR